VNGYLFRLSMAMPPCFPGQAHLRYRAPSVLDLNAGRESVVLGWIEQLSLLAQADDGGGMGWLTIFTIWVPIIVLFYFLLIRPQRAEQQKRQAMLDMVKKNDRVVTIGGIYGVVANVQRDEDEITLKVDESNNTRLRVTVAAVARVIRDDADAKESEKSS